VEGHFRVSPDLPRNQVTDSPSPSDFMAPDPDNQSGDPPPSLLERVEALEFSMAETQETVRRLHAVLASASVLISSVLSPSAIDLR
jgi:hypothetical protein